MNLPCAYRSFPIGNAVNPPYVLYFYENNDDVMADNSNYVKVENLVIELYSENKDFVSEATVETTLKSNHITYTKNEEYIDAITMYRITYETEVVING